MKHGRHDDAPVTDPSELIALAGSDDDTPDERAGEAPRIDNVGLMVRYTFRAFTRRLQFLVTPFGLTAAEFRVLRTLATGGALTQLQIAALAGMDRPYAALIAKQLRAKGLVDAAPDPSDGRRVGMRLSSRGAEVTATIARQLAAVNRAATAGIPVDDMHIFRDVIERIRSNLEGLDGGRDPG